MTVGECVPYGSSSSVKVEIAVARQALNASLFDSDTCTSFPQGYESVTIRSGECSAAAANGLFATVLTGASPDIIVGLACSTDCTFCGFYARGKPDTCIALPLPQFFGKLSFVSFAGVLGVSILAIHFAVLLHL